MTGIEVERLSKEEVRRTGAERWPVWEKKVSRFEWHYDSREECYFLEGRAVIETDGGSVEVKAGDFVRFPAGLRCVWNIVEDVKKHYRFV